MKKTMLLCVPFLMFGYDVQFSKTFSTSLLPNELSTSLNITSTMKSEKEVLSSLDVYTKFIKRVDYIAKESNRISLYPQYKYKDGKSTLIAYRGQVNYKIHTSENDAMKKFLEEFYEIKKMKEVSLSFSSLKWGFSKEMMNEIRDTLRLEAIKWSKNYAQTLSKELHSTCQLKNIGLNNANVQPRLYANDIAMAKSTKEFSMPMPEQLEDDFSIRANITMECQQ